MYAFVYGTLKRGYRNHILLYDSKFIQTAVTKPKYRLYDMGPYPCLVKDKNGNGIKGEIYEINEDTLYQLDLLEGYPELYDRSEIELEDFDKPAIAYFFQENVERLRDCGEQWPKIA